MNLSLNTNDGVSFYKVRELWVHPLFLNLVTILKGRNHKKILISPLVFEHAFLPIFSCVKFISNSEITRSPLGISGSFLNGCDIPSSCVRSWQCDQGE